MRLWPSGGSRPPIGSRPPPFDRQLTEADCAALDAGSSTCQVVGDFSDGHDTGIFSWDYLYFLGAEQERLWGDYEKRLQEAGRERDGPMPLAAAPGCASH